MIFELLWSLNYYDLWIIMIFESLWSLNYYDLWIIMIFELLWSSNYYDLWIIMIFELLIWSLNYYDLWINIMIFKILWSLKYYITLSSEAAWSAPVSERPYFPPLASSFPMNPASAAPLRVGESPMLPGFVRGMTQT
jgi:hypothetical protein